MQKLLFLLAAVSAFAAPTQAAPALKIVAGSVACTATTTTQSVAPGGTGVFTVCALNDNASPNDFVCNATAKILASDGTTNSAAVQVTAFATQAPFTQSLAAPTLPATITTTASGFANGVPTNSAQTGQSSAAYQKLAELTFSVPNTVAAGTTLNFGLDPTSTIGIRNANSATADCNDLDNSPVSSTVANAPFSIVVPAGPTNVTFSRTPATLTFAEGGAAQTIAVSCTGTIGTPSPVTMSVASSNTAAFTVAPASLSFSNCTTPQNVTVTPRAADASSNPTQTGNVTFTNTTSGGTVTVPASVGVTVTDNQSPAVYTVTKSTATVTENSAATDTLTVTCTGAFVAPATSGSVAYSIATLTNTGDITTPPLTGTLNFAACGGATQSITVTPRANDNTVQGTRTGTVTFSGALGGTLSGSTTGTITVNDDDADPVFGLAQVGACAEPATHCAYGIVRQSGVVAPRTVTFTASGTATRGVDYDLKVGTDCATGTLVPVGTNSINHTIAGGQTLNVCVIDDAIVEAGGETVILTLTTAGSTASSAYTLGTPVAGTFTIADDDAAINAVAGNSGSATSTSVVEGNVVRFSVSCPTLAAPFTVNYAITPATPATGDVFVGGGATGSVTCPAGAASLVAVPTTVQTVDDTVIGNNRAYTMTISVPTAQPAPAATVIGNAVAVVSVADNDQPKSIPTLGAAGLGLMSLMLAGLAAFQRRRRA